MYTLRRIRAWLVAEWLLVILIGLLPVLLWAVPTPLGNLVDLVDWKTVAALAGLMVLSRGLELSGLIDRLGRMVLARLRSERGLAVALVVFAALLSAVVTNDVALFVTVPLTLGLARVAALPVARLVIFQALAVNAGSAISPVGNPQNLFLWQRSGLGFVEFTLAMLPIAGAMLVLVLALVPLGFGQARLAMPDATRQLAVRQPLMLVSLVAYPVFLIAVNAGFALIGAGLVIGAFALAFRHVLRGVDWPLLLVFILMFINLGLLGQLPAVAALAISAMDWPGGAYAFGAVLSQGMSNVPAAIFLAPFTEDWRALAWGVNVGGFGLAIGSLANLIALRLGRQPGIWRQFHLWSLPMFGASLAVGAVLLTL
ncbi:YbiR family transporter [Roseinatronobacter monicus]|uniref:YbiR family transporter n=1 Tax=Roseinatronobacter monicus TaxID=393481 RepID=A0A543KFI5_9RHOB|nr:YbiR family transporter [Roseinatronobacter monicus]